LRKDWTIAQAMEYLRGRKIEQQIIYFYVLDEKGALCGVLPTRALLLAEPAARVQDQMQPAVSLPQNASLEEAMEIFSIYRLLALPVVDEQNRLLGMIDVRLYAEEAVDLAQSDRMQDLFQLIGLSRQESRANSAWKSFRWRLPWLGFNLAGGLVCAAIAAHLNGIPGKRLLLLTMFIPLVLTLSESVSMQSMSLSLQFLHTRGVPWKRVLRRGGLEWRTAGLLGLCLGLAATLLSMLWGGGHQPALVVGGSICLAIIGSATIGATMPVLLHLLRLDPRVASGPVALMVTDIITTAIYVGLATWLLA
jgi:magnesium transporter